MAERTKLWIASKMKEFMQKKDVDKIRVSDICEAAEAMFSAMPADMHRVLFGETRA